MTARKRLPPFTSFSVDGWNIDVNLAWCPIITRKLFQMLGIKLSSTWGRGNLIRSGGTMRLAIATLLATTTISGAALAAEPTGDWRTEDGSAIIRIDNCRGALWGVVAWEKE